MELSEKVMELLFPPKCILCHRVLPDDMRAVCPVCSESLPRTRGSRRKLEQDFFSLCVSPLYYDGALRQAVLEYKFLGHAAYAPSFGSLLSDCVREELDGRWDILSWVPLSAQRLRERGYDQTRLLAEALAKELGCSLVPTLEKHRHVPPQSKLKSREERRANISDAFRVMDPDTVQDRRILLIDDIVTTGSTLSECARVLRYAGAQEVVCAALVRSPHT